MGASVTEQVLEDTAAAYEEAVVSARLGDALSAVEGMLARGLPPSDVLLSVISPVQRRVGERWQSGEWSVPQEHAATTIAVSAAQVALREAERRSADRGRIVIACPEHEWHALPALLTAGVLRDHGWHVVLLGASTPTPRLGRYLHDLGPDATGVSSSVFGSLPAARRFIQASTTAGVPVVAGGAAFGTGPERALRMGATAWAPDALSAVDVIGSLPSVVSPAPALDRQAATEQAMLERNHRDLAAAITEAWRSGSDNRLDDEVTETVVAEWLHAVQAVLVTGDREILEDARSWSTAVLEARGLSRADAKALRREVARVLSEYPLSASAFGRT